MAAVVLDASLILAWILPGEAGSAQAGPVIERIVADGAAAPGLWRLEVANVLAIAERRGRLPAGSAVELIERLSDLPVAIDPETSARAWGATLALAQRHGLTVYDAAYLELAQRTGLPLATFDQALKKAAGAENVALAD